MEVMKVRAGLRRYAWVILGVALLIATGAARLLGRHDAPDDAAMMVWYYDLGSSRLFPASVDALPPIPAPQDPSHPSASSEGVRAMVFSCGSCQDTAGRFVAYVEKYTPEARAKRVISPGTASESAPAMPGDRPSGSRMPASEKVLRGIDPEDSNEGLLIARVDPDTPAEDWKWRPKTDEAVAAIEEEAGARCGENGHLQSCVPRSP